MVIFIILQLYTVISKSHLVCTTAKIKLDTTEIYTVNNLDHVIDMVKGGGVS